MLKKIAIQVQLAHYSGMMSATVQLQVLDVYNCSINAQVRAADDQSDSTILI